MWKSLGNGLRTSARFWHENAYHERSGWFGYAVGKRNTNVEGDRSGSKGLFYGCYYAALMPFIVSFALQAWNVIPCLHHLPQGSFFLDFDWRNIWHENVWWDSLLDADEKGRGRGRKRRSGGGMGCREGREVSDSLITCFRSLISKIQVCTFSWSFPSPSSVIRSLWLFTCFFYCFACVRCLIINPESSTAYCQHLSLDLSTC